jgi:hypothetical protein
MRMPGAPSVPETGPRRASASRSSTTTAAAPARCAPRALAANGQTPRRTSAIRPRGKPSQSPSRQPASVRSPPTTRTAPRAFPPAEYASVRTSVPVARRRPPGRTTSGGRRSSKNGNVTRAKRTVHPACFSRAAIRLSVATPPGVPAARVPRLAVAVAASARRCVHGSLASPPARPPAAGAGVVPADIVAPSPPGPPGAPATAPLPSLSPAPPEPPPHPAGAPSATAARAASSQGRGGQGTPPGWRGGRQERVRARRPRPRARTPRAPRPRAP